MTHYSVEAMTNLLRHAAANTRPNELCIAWQRQVKMPYWYGKQTLESEMKKWRKMKRQNKIYIKEEESREVKIDGEPWHILILHEGTPENPNLIGLDPLGLGIDDRIISVDGLIYFFRNKANRDMIVTYVNKTA